MQWRTETSESVPLSTSEIIPSSWCMDTSEHPFLDPSPFPLFLSCDWLDHAYGHTRSVEGPHFPFEPEGPIRSNPGTAGFGRLRNRVDRRGRS